MIDPKRKENETNFILNIWHYFQAKHTYHLKEGDAEDNKNNRLHIDGIASADAAAADAAWFQFIK